MCGVEFVMSSVISQCQISGGVGGGGEGRGLVRINIFNLLKALIVKFLEIASLNR